MVPFDNQRGIWEKGASKSRRQPKGRQVDDIALKEITSLIADRPLKKDLLIEHLHLIQDAYGYISANHITALADIMKLAQAEVYEVASFYAHFDVVKENETPPPPLTIRVCDSLSCELAGSEILMKEVTRELNPQKVRVIRAPCMGRCDTAPVAEVGRHHVDQATCGKIKSAIQTNNTCPSIPNYEKLSTYKANGGYQELKKLQRNGNWEDVQNKILVSGLRGLGGAGFPSGKKWHFVRMHKGPRYLAVNGDEGEPGTFKDRYYLERVPHLFLEGMLIAGWAVEAVKSYIYLRDEYPAVREILIREIKALEDAGMVPVGYIELRRGAGSYICGEESAMIESIEGKRGLPRHRPPFVAEIGIFGRPTLVHNVETLLWVAKVIREGPEILNSVERNGRKGLRSYSVSGRVNNPGVYLLPAGSTIIDIIEAAGGMLIGHRFKAYQPGGPSSGLLPASINDVPLDFDTLQPFGTFIGSAAVVILSHQDSTKLAAVNMLRFFEDESCGQCTPCRVGCEKALKLMASETWDRNLLEDLCQVMTDASICGLGQAAPNPIRSVMQYFPEDVQ